MEPRARPAISGRRNGHEIGDDITRPNDVATNQDAAGLRRLRGDLPKRVDHLDDAHV
jgi:hypothetical protein